MQTIELKEFHGNSTLKVSAKFQSKTKLIAEISGNLSNIDFPEISLDSTRKNELWTIGCFEIFVSKKDASYTEYNFGFDANWECFEFSDYRLNQTRPQILPPKITINKKNDIFMQTTEFQEDIISTCSFSITAAIKLKNGEFLYFANEHCGQNPDFHLKSARSLKF